MGKLLYIEWLKVKHYRTFWILLALFIISVVGINYVIWELNNDLTKNPAGVLLADRYFGYPLVWQVVTYSSSFLLFLPGLYMIISITNEYTYKTHRQNVIDGLSRSQFIGVKLVMVLIAAAFATLVVGITAVAFAQIAGNGFSTEGIEFLGYYFLMALSYIALGLMLGTLVRRSGLAVILYMTYIGFIEVILAGILGKFFGQARYFLPLEPADTLIPFPALKEIQKQMVTRPEPMYLLIGASVYLLIYLAVTKWRYETADL